MAEIDDKAFNSMKEATAVAPDRLFENKRVFTESEYNTNANNAERGKYDSQAYFHLQALYHEDKKKKRFQTFSFPEYLQNLDNKYLEEKFAHSRDDDPEYYREAGNLLNNIYAGDAEQLKLSAYNVYSGIGATDEPSRGRDRSNVSIKAPESTSY